MSLPWLGYVRWGSILLANLLRGSPCWWINYVSMARNCRQPLITESGLWIPASKKLGFSLIQLHGNEVCQNLVELQSGFFPRRASRWEQSLTDTLTATLWDTKQRTQLSHAYASYRRNSKITKRCYFKLLISLW